MGPELNAILACSLCLHCAVHCCNLYATLTLAYFCAFQNEGIYSNPRFTYWLTSLTVRIPTSFPHPPVQTPLNMAAYRSCFRVAMSLFKSGTGVYTRASYKPSPLRFASPLEVSIGSQSDGSAFLSAAKYCAEAGAQGG